MAQDIAAALEVYHQRFLTWYAENSPNVWEAPPKGTVVDEDHPYQAVRKSDEQIAKDAESAWYHKDAVKLYRIQLKAARIDASGFGGIPGWELFLIVGGGIALVLFLIGK